MLEIWPEFPVFVYSPGYQTKEAGDDVAAALRLNHRVSRIRIEKTSDSEWETFAPLIHRPFPILIHLWIQPSIAIKNVISRSFLGGSAPSLRDLHLVRIPFPALPELLLSATNLVRLRHDRIPCSGYIPPQAMVTGLSALTRLKSLSLSFRSPQSLPQRAIRIPPPHTRTLLPALTYLLLQGSPEYMEDLVAQIDAPLLESVQITLFNQEVLEVSELAKFVRRADKLSLLDQAKVIVRSFSISITLSPNLLRGEVESDTLTLHLRCPESALRLSYIGQFCVSCLPTLSPFESLHIHFARQSRWQDVVDNLDPQWLDFLCLFSTVKSLFLSERVDSRVAQTLRGLSAERVMDVLPALKNLIIPWLKPSPPVQEAISEFADARQLSGHPLFVCDWDDWFMAGGYIETGPPGFDDS